MRCHSGIKACNSFLELFSGLLAPLVSGDIMEVALGGRRLITGVWCLCSLHAIPFSVRNACAMSIMD